MPTAALALLGIPVAIIAQRSDALGAGLGVALALSLALRVARRPEEGAYALVALAPLTDLGEFVPGSGVRITYVVLGAALVGWVFGLLRRTEPAPRAHWLLLALAAPLAAGLLSVPASLDPSRSLLYCARLAGLLATVAFVAVQMRAAERVRTLVATLVATGVALTTVALVQVALPEAGIGRMYSPTFGDTVGVMRPAAFFLDPNFLGGLLSVCALAAGVMAIHALDRQERFAWAAGAIACSFGMALTVSRSAWVGFAVGAVVLVATAPRERRLGMAVVLAAFAAAAVVAVPGTVARLAGGLDGSASTRLTLARAEAEIAARRPLTGTGLAMLGKAYEDAGGYAKTGRVLNPHQVPLAVVAETGVAGLAAEVAILAGLAAAAAKRWRRGWDPLDSVVACALAALIVQSLFQYYAYFEPMWLVLALAAAAPERA